MEMEPYMITLLDPSKLDETKPFPTYSEPKPISEMSINKERQVLLDRSEAKYFYRNVLKNGGQSSFNLSKGFDQFESKEKMNLPKENINHLCSWITAQAKPGMSLKEACHGADIVTYRGLLTRIGCTPYDKRDGWKFCAVRIGSTILFNELETARKSAHEANMSERERKMCYWGRKFEQYVTTDEPEICKTEPVVNVPVTDLSEFDVLFTTTIGEQDSVRILMSAETDCIDADGKYLELKTQLNSMSGNFWKQKALKWWMQSFLVGTKRIVVGYRNQEGVVWRVSRINVNSLYKSAVNWSPQGAFNFLLDTLQALRKKMNGRTQMEYWLFQYDPILGEVGYKPLAYDSKYGNFLPKDFVERFVPAQDPLFAEGDAQHMPGPAPKLVARDV